MDTREIITQLTQFRQQVYQSFRSRTDALVDLVDALSGNTAARSVAELSPSSLHRREYSALYDGIDNFFQASSVEAALAERRSGTKAHALGGGPTPVALATEVLVVWDRCDTACPTFRAGFRGSHFSLPDTFHHEWTNDTNFAKIDKRSFVTFVYLCHS